MIVTVLIAVATFFGVGLIAPMWLAVAAAVVVGLFTALNVAGWRAASAERGMTLRDEMRVARHRRDVLDHEAWSDRRESWPCAHCHTAFRTEGGLHQHEAAKHAAA